MWPPNSFQQLLQLVGMDSSDNFSLVLVATSSCIVLVSLLFLCTRRDNSANEPAQPTVPANHADPVDEHKPPPSASNVNIYQKFIIGNGSRNSPDSADPTDAVEPPEPTDHTCYRCPLKDCTVCGSYSAVKAHMLDVHDKRVGDKKVGDIKACKTHCSCPKCHTGPKHTCYRCPHKRADGSPCTFCGSQALVGVHMSDVHKRGGVAKCCVKCCDCPKAVATRDANATTHSHSSSGGCCA